MAKALVAIILCLSFAAPVAAAAPVQPKAAAQTKPAKPAKPDWSELTPARQNVLAPLKEGWGSLDTVSRKKWVGVADRYPKMKPAEQQRLQTRMKDWAKLTPEQRRVAREKYLALKKMPPAKREQVKTQWQQYQQSLAAKSEPGSQEIVTGQEPASSGTQQ
jgi:hypothetical protein